MEELESRGSRAREEEWTLEGFPVLRAVLTLPAVEGLPERIRKIYALEERCFLRYCQRELLPWAEAQGRAALERSVPPRRLSASLTWRETFRQGTLWSLYTQVREEGLPAGVLFTRRGDVWNLEGGFPVEAGAFFPDRRWRQSVLRTIGEAARRFPGARPQSMRRFFSPRRYYLTDAGVAFFYPQGALDPTGPTEFVIPWEKERGPLRPEGQSGLEGTGGDAGTNAPL